MEKMFARALMNSVGTAAYIVLVVSFIFSLQAFSDKPDNNLLIPMAMLMLFVCSAAITGFLVFGKPVMLYLDGKKKEATTLLGYTLGMLVVLTVLFFTVLIVYYLNFY